MDAEGNIWQAIYGEGKVLKIDSRGKVVGEIRYPTKCITCPVFVGTELWVTTAGGGEDGGEDGEDGEEGEEEEGGGDELAGAVFRVDVGVRGLPDFKFKLEEGVPGLL